MENLSNPFSLEGKTILVTGASSGIGRATAVEVARLGARLVLVARDENRLNETLEALAGDGHSVISADLTDETALARVVEECG
ncbi:MAG: SDR family NAD(P)-dependent oxidoreductase, partial [Muribaculaceae bacterium]|nr:SDR family NAD(P)-dependent oxidoreductase [Muribaculaceae bacterium]